MSASAALPLNLRPLRGEVEARFCAGFMIASEPWVTLGLAFDQALERLTNPDREIIVATIEPQIVGVMILHLAGLLNGYVQTIVVRPDWRCRGIGTRMIEWAEARIFRQSPNVFMCVSSFNGHAQRLYERLGYRHVGELSDFLVQGHAEILLRKTRGPWLTYKPAA